MAVGQDNLERDPQLARIYAAAGGEEPPAEFDAAIRAAARRAVGAGPAAAGAPPRAKRNWYVPLSLAAMLVLSVSLVTLVREEKGSELTQAPAPASAPVPAAPPMAQAPEVQSKGVEAAAMKDASGATMTEAKREDAVKPAPEPAANVAKTRAPAEQREKSVAAPLRKTEEVDAAARASAPRAEPAAPSGPAAGGVSGVIATAPAPQREAEIARDAASADSTRPPPAPAVKPAQVLPAETKLATPMVEGRVEERSRAPERPALRSARRDAPAAAAASPSRPAWLTDLENQPADKWLERLAEFRREGRQADADILLAEFRKRYPDHPVSR